MWPHRHQLHPTPTQPSYHPHLTPPQISKLVTRGVDRPSTLATMRRALDSYVIRGVQHNAPLLRSVLDIPAFQDGQISTAFLAGEPVGRGNQGGECACLCCWGCAGGRVLVEKQAPPVAACGMTTCRPIPRRPACPPPTFPAAENFPTPESSAPDRLPLSSGQEDQLLALAAMLWAGREQRLSGGGNLQVRRRLAGGESRVL